MDFEDTKENYVDRIDFKRAIQGSLPDEPPLLQELGINFNTIKKESLMIFKVFKSQDIKVTFIDDADMSGPIIFILLYTLCLFINCKVHFGYVYLISLVSVTSIYFLLNVIDTTPIGLLQCCSVIGYSFVPMVIFSFLNIFLNWTNSTIKASLGILCSLWSSYIATVVFVKYLAMTNKDWVVWYPIMLIYGCFALLVVF